MPDIYLDNPSGIEKWLSTLSTRDNRLVDTGIALGLRMVEEELTDYKIKLYGTLMDTRESSEDREYEAQLLARIHSVCTICKALQQRLELTNSPF